MPSVSFAHPMMASAVGSVATVVPLSSPSVAHYANVKDLPQEIVGAALGV